MANAYINDFTATVQTYYKELTKYCSITKEQEKELIKKAKKNNIKARNQILTSNLKFVFDVAKNYKGCGVPLEDLISEGNMGLTKAIEKFDEKQDVKFISYAVWWIKQSIWSYVKKKQMLSNIEINESEEFNMTVKENPLYDEEDDMISKSEIILSNEDDEFNKELNKSQRRLLNYLLSTIEGRELDIITLYYGLGNNKPLTLEMIGKKYGISKERVRQICKKTLKKFRSEILKKSEIFDISFCC